jgi:hypothetical protein
MPSSTSSVSAEAVKAEAPPAKMDSSLSAMKQVFIDRAASFLGEGNPSKQVCAAFFLFFCLLSPYFICSSLFRLILSRTSYA